MPITVYVDMVADLFHLGHVEFLRKAKEHGDVLKVGVRNDETAEGYKRKPVCDMRERIAVVAACRYVDAVIPNAPLHVSREYLLEHKVDVIVHGDDLSDAATTAMYGDVLDLLRRVPYTPSISTTKIIGRLSQYQNHKSQELRAGGSRRAQSQPPRHR